jgi:DNA-binding XRE family transcriptional regulator
MTGVLVVLGCLVQRRVPMAVADVFRVPMDVTYAIRGGEPALMAYRRWRNISRDDLAAKSGIPRIAIEAIEDGKTDIEEAMLESLSAVLNVPQDQLI